MTPPQKRRCAVLGALRIAVEEVLGMPVMDDDEPDAVWDAMARLAGTLAKHYPGAADAILDLVDP